MHLSEKTLNSEQVYDGRIFKIKKDMVELENGKTADREVVCHSGGVCVVPMTADNNVLLVKQFRYPFLEATVEVPAGKINYGEDHEECGRRELLEETGMTAGEFTYLGCLYPTPAYDTETIHMYLARNLEQHNQHLDDDEFLDVLKVPFDEAVKMIMENKLPDAKTQIALLRTKVLLNL